MNSVILTAATLILTVTTRPAGELPQSLDLDAVRAIPTQHAGRMPPLDTLARELVESVTGEVEYLGHDPVLLLLAWTFQPDYWKQQPLITIGNGELRKELQLPAKQSRYSYVELVGADHLMDLVDQLPKSREHPLDPLQKKVSGISDQLMTLRSIFVGNAIPLVPAADSVIASWRPISGAGAAGEEIPGEVRSAWRDLRAAFLADDNAAFEAATGRLEQALAAVPTPYRPSPQDVALELRYNRLQPFRSAWELLLVGFVLTLLAILLNWRKVGAPAGARVLADALATVALLGGLGLLTYGLWMRGHIAGRLPAANMYESMLFLSWGAAACAIVASLVILILRRGRVVPLTAAGLGALALMLADLLPIDGSIRPVMPVLLDTAWMTIHVPVIMISYAVLALAVLIAHVQLVAMASMPRHKRLIERIDNLHYWYASVGAFLLLVGIITGSMWGAASWGRYWGWDPKEVWSLVAFLGYMAIFHVRVSRERVPRWAYVVAAGLAAFVFGAIARNLAPLSGGEILGLAGAAVAGTFFVLARGALATSLKSILAFWLIVMTYVGVNYVLGIGLHSYAFGTGAVVYHMFMIGTLDLALMATCSTVYLIRRYVADSSEPVPAPALALASAAADSPSESPAQ